MHETKCILFVIAILAAASMPHTAATAAEPVRES